MIQQGVIVQPGTTAPFMLLDLYSPNGTYDNIFLANYATINLQYALTRVSGVASVQIFGAGPYAMRIWVNPDRLASLGVTVPDIINAVQAQNKVNPAGQIGGEPVPQGPAVHLQRARSGTPAHARGVRRDHRPCPAGWLHAAPERRRARGNGIAILFLQGAIGRPGCEANLPSRRR